MIPGSWRNCECHPGGEGLVPTGLQRKQEIYQQRGGKSSRVGAQLGCSIYQVVLFLQGFSPTVEGGQAWGQEADSWASSASASP